ncbi:TfoX/Sxy family protein [Cellulomonas massiliensis]|uniref:TfoX/Sxy family protein n=1 Tax=Cellulomonas massiliensis TaxID=1465811 RepID=UPI0002DC795E|nr:TfoX/Sxy family protein [Cellulomonas massiliensis]
MYDETLAQRVRDLLEPRGGVTEKRMFGGLAFLVDGSMAVCVSGRADALMVRVPADATAERLAQPGTRPMVMSGRETRGWVYVEKPVVADDDELRRWVDEGVRTAEALARG